MRKQSLIYPALMLALLSGCSFIPTYERPVTEVPTGWTENGSQSPTAIAKDWWKNFNSAELNSLMDQALANNNDLGAAIQRVEQARALARVAGAPLLPSVDGTAGASVDRLDPGEGDSSTDKTASVGLSVGYELDLFGANRAELEAAEADAEGAAFSRDSTALIIMGDTAKAYFNVLNLEERLKIATQNLDSSKELLRIVQARFDAGATTLLDVAQQKTDLANREANLATVEQQLKNARSALAVLVGKPPQSLTVAEKDLRSLAVPEIAPGQPSRLLERRPDIRSAESSLLAANADIGAARAAFFPSITLGLDLAATRTPSLGDPTGTALSLASSLIAPIFKGGLLEGNLAYTKARKEELVSSYRKTVLTSFKDVEDALAAVKASQQRETALETALNESRKAYDLSKQQYDVGSIDFQTLLDTRQTMLLAEDNYVQTKNERLAAAVDLYKALGGGWAEESQATPEASASSAPDPMPATDSAPPQPLTPSPLAPQADASEPVTAPATTPVTP